MPTIKALNFLITGNLAYIPNEKDVHGSVNTVLWCLSRLRSASASDLIQHLLLYLVFMKVSEEKPFSHRYVVTRKKHMPLSESAGYTLSSCIQKSNNVWFLKVSHHKTVLLNPPAQQMCSPRTSQMLIQLFTSAVAEKYSLKSVWERQCATMLSLTSSVRVRLLSDRKLSKLIEHMK